MARDARGGEPLKAAADTPDNSLLTGGRGLSAPATSKLDWSCHTPNLLKEVLTNESAGVLRMPLTIFGQLLAEVATRASELNDPALNLLMLRLTLYDVADPEKHSPTEITEAYQSQRDRLAAQ